MNIGYAERMICVVGGPALALYGLTRRSPSAIPLALLGGYLLYRGMSGRCLAYHALGKAKVKVAPFRS